VIVYYDKLPRQWVGSFGCYYMARAVESTGKLEVFKVVMSQGSLPKFIRAAEQALKEACTEIVFHRDTGQPWTKAYKGETYAN
jgi:hypothetical protein